MNQAISLDFSFHKCCFLNKVNHKIIQFVLHIFCLLQKQQVCNFQHNNNNATNNNAIVFLISSFCEHSFLFYYLFKSSFLVIQPAKLAIQEVRDVFSGSTCHIVVHGHHGPASYSVTERTVRFTCSSW